MPFYDDNNVIPNVKIEIVDRTFTNYHLSTFSLVFRATDAHFLK